MNIRSCLLSLVQRGGRAALPLLLVAGFGALASQAGAQTQEEARAIFLFNFAKNVEWPAESFADNATPITIAVVGNKEVARALERAVRGKDANGRDITVQALNEAAGAGSAHIVYVGHAKHTEAVIAEIGGKPILTVGEEETFIASGGVIRLFSDGDKVRCMISVKRSEAAGLKLGEKLVKASNS